MHNQELLQAGTDQFGLHLDGEQLARLMVYFDELKKWSKRINLIARDTSDKEIIENHFIDSLSLLMILDSPQYSLVDVGSGAGFPGMVLAAAEPERTYILVEPRKKRTSFLNHIKRVLSLKNVVVINSRVEDCLDKDELQKIGYVTSRAVAAPDTFLPMVAPLLKRGATAILMLASKKVAATVGSIDPSCSVASTMSFALPYSGASRILLKVVHSKE